MSKSISQKHIAAGRRRRAALWLGAAAALGAGVARADDWPGLGLGADRARLSTETLGATFASGATWQNRLPDGQESVYRALVASPAAADGFVVFGTSDNRLRALRESDGQLLWEVGTIDAVLASPVLYRGRAYAATVAGQLLAVNLADGSTAWSQMQGGAVYGAPTVADGALYVTVGNPAPALARLAPDTGAVTWTTPAGTFTQAVHSAPAVSGGHVVVGQMDGVWRSFSAATGAPEWTARTGGTVQMTGALIQNGTVYAVATDTKLSVYAFDLATGATRAGWPLAVALPADQAAGTPVSTRFVTSSLAAGSGGGLAFQVRRDDRFDANADGVVDLVSMDELIVGIDAGAATVAWTSPGAHLTVPDDNHVPAFGLSPSPAAFPGTGGGLLLAGASTLDGSFRVVDAATGAGLATHATGGVTRGSPVVANAGLILGTDDGALVRWPSTANQPPDPPVRQFVPAAGATADVASLQLGWGAALEPDGEAVTYVVRWDDDGEVLHDWDGEIVTTAEQTSVRPTGLLDGHTYTWSVRARDARGAFSPWSAYQTFLALVVPPVSVGGHDYPSPQAALAAAMPGDVVTLGAGTYWLGESLVVPAGVTLAGAAPHLTTLAGNGHDPAIVLRGGSGGKTALRSVTVAGASVGVRVDSGDDVELRNVILRDNAQAGLEVAAGAHALLASATVLRNPTGASALGALDVRNALITANDVGLAAADPTARLTTSYSDVFANRTADRSGVADGLGDMSLAVRFATEVSDDARLANAQASTDHGDPGDDFAQEPAPNGGRVNIGAFGNTPYAELSATFSALTDGTRAGATPTSSTTPADSAGGGCTFGGGPRRNPRLADALLPALFALAAARRSRRRR